MSKFGPQPVHRILSSRGYGAILRTADELGIPRIHFKQALRGGVHPSDEMRERLSAYLNKPVEELFTPAALAKRYNPNYNVGKKVTR
ncbi:hypothetical protein [Micromonospora sp. CA-246542]|uniref:hypothetical protein n=1 Tax=Micromonospora sp. CA-246542 TaxID=3239959 RepID=UPI003D8CB182